MMIKRKTENRKKRHNEWIKVNEISIGNICIICSYKMLTIIFPIVQVSDLTQMQRKSIFILHPFISDFPFDVKCL